MGAVSADFILKWKEYFLNFRTVNIYSIVIAAGTILISVLFPKITHKVPGSLVAILFATFFVNYFHLNVETIEADSEKSILLFLFRIFLILIFPPCRN